VREKEKEREGRYRGKERKTKGKKNMLIVCISFESAVVQLPRGHDQDAALPSGRRRYRYAGQEAEAP
jgi:hypothetical protein